MSPVRRSLFVAVAAFVMTTLVAGVADARGKPGYPDRIAWSGGTWQVKTSRAPVGPGPNVFSAANVSVGSNGFLHLRIARDGSTWTTAEIIGPTSYGYGTYRFTVATPLDAFDPNVVLGLFTWSDKAPYAHREIDIEVARWGDAADATNAQFVVQPWDRPDHLERFTATDAVRTIQEFTWRAGVVSFVSRTAGGDLVAAYTYSGTDVPKPGDERVRLNLWLFNGAAPLNGQSAEVVVESFGFTP